MNKKIKKIVSVLSVCLLVMGLFAGCGSKVTVESLLLDVQKSVKDVKSVKMHATADGKMNLSELGSMEMGMDMDISSTLDPKAAYAKGSFHILGQSVDLENYVIAENKEVLTYTGIMGNWILTKDSYEKEDSANILAGVGTNLLRNLDLLKLEEETKEVNGTEAYVISGTVKGEEIEALFDSMNGTFDRLLGEEDDFFTLKEWDALEEWEDLSVQLELGIRKEDKLPLYIHMNFGNLSVEKGSEKAAISDVSVKIEFTEFNTVDQITVPQDVIDSAMEMPDD